MVYTLVSNFRSIYFVLLRQSYNEVGKIRWANNGTYFFYVAKVLTLFFSTFSVTFHQQLRLLVKESWCTVCYKSNWSHILLRRIAMNRGEIEFQCTFQCFNKAALAHGALTGRALLLSGALEKEQPFTWRAHIWYMADVSHSDEDYICPKVANNFCSFCIAYLSGRIFLRPGEFVCMRS